MYFLRIPIKITLINRQVMKKNKKTPIREAVGKILNNTTCFKAHRDCEKECEFEKCRYWMSSKDDLNCVLIASDRGPKTLQEIGDIFGVTRMRICQIEKNVLDRIKIKKESIS